MRKQEKKDEQKNFISQSEKQKAKYISLKPLSLFNRF